MADTLIPFYIRNLPPGLKDRLFDDAAEQESSLNAVAVKILADHYSVAIDSDDVSKRRGQPNGGTPDVVLLRIPDSLDVAMRTAAAAARPRRSANQAAAAVLCQHYGIRAAIAA